ncbi:MAG TPA: 50S ribosome-binding GTPase, partial [Hyphomicrobiaceae bacterium]|nr:50S ribosome-binding GTPase [Hyphomicrobiaceae bacterium]
MTRDRSFTDALDALRRIADSPELRPGERKAVAQELRDVEAMRDKLAEGRVEITAFGEINAGKSALLNALLGREVFKVAARGGETKVRSAEEWRPDVRELSGLGTKLVVVDTPGLNEVDGAHRARIAERTVRQSDIVLFVVRGDLNDVEISALRELSALHKPLILVLNQIDRFRKSELVEALAAIKSRVAGLVADRDIVF